MRDIFRRHLLFAALGLNVACVATTQPTPTPPTPAPEPTPDAAIDTPPPSYTAISLDGFADAIRGYQERHGTDYERHAPIEILEIADNLLLWQRDSGGWLENEDPARVLSADERLYLETQRTTNNTSFENHNIYPQVEYLAAVYEQTKDAKYRNAFLRGLEFMLSAQNEDCGGFPYSVPGREKFHSYITIAGDVTVGVLSSFRKVARREAPFQTIESAWAERAAKAVASGNECLLRLQLAQNGGRTGWAGRYDQFTLEPSGGRGYELPALVSGETAGVVRYLMGEDNPSPTMVAAIEGAVAWLYRSALKSVRVETFQPATEKGHRPALGVDRRIAWDPTAPLLWARFYDPKDNTVVLANRDGARVFKFDQVHRERRIGYDWYGYWPTELVAIDYPRWKEKRRPSRGDTPPTPPSVCTTLQATKTAKAGNVSNEDEISTDTARIQNALNSCGYGRAVELRAQGKAKTFVSGPLTLPSGVSLTVAEGTTLWASRNPRDYDTQPGRCGAIAGGTGGCRPLISVENAADSGIYGDGVIDGRGGATLFGQDQTWWEVAHAPKHDGQSPALPRLIAVKGSLDFTLHGISLYNTPESGVWAQGADGLVAWGVKIKNPKTARGTSGMEIASSSHVTVTRSFIETGADNVAIKAGSNTPSRHTRITMNHLYGGHGLVVGGDTDGVVEDLQVESLTIDGTRVGLQLVAGRGKEGIVNKVHYQDVCLRDVPQPILFDTTSAGRGIASHAVYQDIVLRDVYATTPGRVTFLGTDKDHPLAVTLDNVFITGGANDPRSAFVDATVGPRAGNVLPTGETDVSIERAANTPGIPNNCDNRFTAFPATPDVPEPALRVPPEDPTFSDTNPVARPPRPGQRAAEPTKEQPAPPPAPPTPDTLAPAPVSPKT